MHVRMNVRALTWLWALLLLQALTGHYHFDPTRAHGAGACLQGPTCHCRHGYVPLLQGGGGHHDALRAEGPRDGTLNLLGVRTHIEGTVRTWTLRVTV